MFARVKESPVRQVLRFAHERFSRSKHWEEYYQEVMAFAAERMTPEELEGFRETREYAVIDTLVRTLTAFGGVPSPPKSAEPDPEKAPKRKPRKRSRPQFHTVITVRLPYLLHEDLRDEAAQLGISLNRLCISKLIAPLREVEESEEQAA